MACTIVVVERDVDNITRIDIQKKTVTFVSHVCFGERIY